MKHHQSTRYLRGSCYEIKFISTKRFKTNRSCYRFLSTKFNKSAERANRGQSSRIILKSALSKIPREFSKFLSNGENKTRMIELIVETVQRKKANVLNNVRTTKTIFSREDHYHSISLSSNDTFGNLLSNDEEADTKIIAHAMQFLEENENHRVIIRSPSGNTDILVLTVCLI